MGIKYDWKREKKWLEFYNHVITNKPQYNYELLKRWGYKKYREWWLNRD